MKIFLFCTKSFVIIVQFDRPVTKFCTCQLTLHCCPYSHYLLKLQLKILLLVAEVVFLWVKIMNYGLQSSSYKKRH